MKTALSIVFALVLALPSVATEVDFSKPTSWQEALGAAKDANKYLFVDAYTDWCGWCKVMDQKTFTDGDVARLMNDKFVNVKIEMETGFGIDVAMKYRVSSFPQFLVFTPQGKLVYRMYGFRPPEDFLPELRKALDPATQESYPGITSAFPLDAPDFLRGFFGKSKERMVAGIDIESWLDKQDDPTSEVAWTVMSRCPLNEKWENWVLQHQTELGTLYGAEAEQKVFRIVYGKVLTAIKQQDRQAFENALDMWPEGDDRESFVNSMELQYLSAGENWEGLVQKLHDLVEADAVAASVVNEHCWTLYEKCDLQPVLKQAAHIMGHVVEGQNWATWDTYASLQYKTGDLKGAEVSAQKAISMGKEAGENVTATEELLTKIKAAQ